MSDTAFTHFLGEGEQRFCLTPKLIPELERATEAGVGTLFKRLADGHFRFAEITQTIRLGLIGGGMSPENAAHLCTVYVEDRPLSETYPIALSILERLWFGAPVADALAAELKAAAGA